MKYLPFHFLSAYLWGLRDVATFLRSLLGPNPVFTQWAATQGANCTSGAILGFSILLKDTSTQWRAQTFWRTKRKGHFTVQFGSQEGSLSCFNQPRGQFSLFGLLFWLPRRHFSTHFSTIGPRGGNCAHHCFNMYLSSAPGEPGFEPATFQSLVH